MIDHEEIIKLIDEAGKLILSYYKKKINTQIKDDSSPVTDADIHSHQLIESKLKLLTPNIPIISEECQNHDDLDIKSLKDFWLIDPIDGTDGFLQGNDNFTINIAYMQDKKPKYGFIILPTEQEIYYNDDHHTYLIDRHKNKHIIRVREVPKDGYVILMSSKVSADTLALLDKFNPKTIRKIGSALKFCYIAAGKADLYLRNGATMEWDTAAGDAILTKAGGSITDLDGNEFLYCKPNFRNSSFIAKGNLQLIDKNS